MAFTISSGEFRESDSNIRSLLLIGRFKLIIEYSFHQLALDSVFRYIECIVNLLAPELFL